MANLLNSIATDHNFNAENHDAGLNYTKYLEGKYGQITDTTKNLMWFIQVNNYGILPRT